MSNSLSYNITIGSLSINNSSDKSDRILKSLFCEHSMDGIGGSSIIELSDIDNSAPQLGDEVVVKIDSGDGEKQVFKGEVEYVAVSPVSQTVNCSDDFSKLAKYDIQGSYEDSTADTIVKDILSQAGVSEGTVEEGPEFASYVLFNGPRALNHIKKLARLCGFDIFTDGEGKIHFSGIDTKGAEHTFQYGVNLQDFNLRETQPVNDGFEVLGEGAAGTDGAEKYYWLPDDLSGAKGMASLDSSGKVVTGKSGDFPAVHQNGALRSKESSDKVAEGMVKHISGKKIKGYVKLQGAAGIFPGDIVKVSDIPDNHGISPFFKSGEGLRVRRVRHSLTAETGLVSRVDF